MNITGNIDINVALINQILPIEKSFDVMGRYIEIGGKKSYIAFIDGFAKDIAMIHILKELQKLKPEDISTSKQLMLKMVPYIEVTEQNDINKITDAVLTGQLALVVDGFTNALIIDAREYPSREPSESTIEKVTRGPRDDLVETLVYNTALIRRRIRDPQLVFEVKQVGSMSKTDVAIGYIADKADKKLLAKLKKRIEEIDIHALTMGEKSMEEVLMNKKWYNPLPTFRISERPDTIAAHILEGDIIVLVDASPTAMILPSTLWSFTQYVEDYYQTPLVGTLSRVMRLFAFFIALFITPLFLLLTQYPQSVPGLFSMLMPPQEAELSAFSQLLILEFGLEMLRLSSLHTPESMESAFSIIGGLILGDFAVSMNLFIPDTLFFSVACTIGVHCIPNPEMSDAVKVFRWVMLIATGFFKIWGFIISFIVILIITCTTKTFDDSHGYLWPVIPFDKEAFKKMTLRYSLGKFERKK